MHLAWKYFLRHFHNQTYFKILLTPPFPPQEICESKFPQKSLIFKDLQWCCGWTGNELCIFSLTEKGKHLVKVNNHKLNCESVFEIVLTLSNVAHPENMAVLRISYAVMFFRALLWTGGESCSNGVYPESGFALVDHVFKSFHVDHLVSCYIFCATQPSCQSLNYNPDEKTCQLNNDTKYFRPKYFVEKPLFVYAENPSSGKLRCSCFICTELMHQQEFSLQFHQLLLQISQDQKFCVRKGSLSHKKGTSMKTSL